MITTAPYPSNEGGADSDTVVSFRLKIEYPASDPELLYQWRVLLLSEVLNATFVRPERIPLTRFEFSPSPSPTNTTRIEILVQFVVLARHPDIAEPTSAEVAASIRAQLRDPTSALRRGRVGGAADPDSFAATEPPTTLRM